MTKPTSNSALFAACAALVLAACATQSPSDPDQLAAAGESRLPTVAAHLPANNPPVLRLTTTPPYDDPNGIPHTVTGTAPFTVKFNLCQSSDPDTQQTDPTTGQPDSLNWLFHWGDDGTSALGPHGFNANFSGECRSEHEYRGGTFVATLGVTDKHLFDQSGDVSASAQATTQVTVNSIVRPAGNSTVSVTSVRSPL